MLKKEAYRKNVTIPESAVFLQSQPPDFLPVNLRSTSDFTLGNSLRFILTLNRRIGCNAVLARFLRYIALIYTIRYFRILPALDRAKGVVLKPTSQPTALHPLDLPSL